MEFLKNIFAFFNKENLSGPTSQSLFGDEKKNIFKIKCTSDCPLNYVCKFKTPDWLCKYVKTDFSYDKNKKTIIILDDNEGVISFLLDDLKALDEQQRIELANYNIVSFHGQDAAFSAIATIRALNGMNIIGGILDITIGGVSIDGNKKSVIYTGVDVFLEIIKHSINAKLIFFTGNKLNPHITKNKQLIDSFYDVTNRNIFDYVFYKSNFSKSERREKLLSLFQEN